MPVVDGGGTSSTAVASLPMGGGVSSNSPNAFVASGAGLSSNATATVEVALVSISPDPVLFGMTMVITGVNLHLVQILWVDGVSIPFEIIDNFTIHVELPLLAEGVKTIYAEYV